MQQSTPPLVYEKHYYNGGEMNTPPCDIYTAHRVYRASPRFLWVNAEPLWGEPYTQAHPDTLRTYRLDRAVLDAGGVLTRYAQRQLTDWVLSLPATAVAEGEGRWCDYA